MRVLIVAFRNFANALKVNDFLIIASDRLIYCIIIFQEIHYDCGLQVVVSDVQRAS